MAVASFEEAAGRTWSDVLDRARRELPESSFAMWFTGVRATSLHDGVLEVVAPSDYVRDWLAKHYVEMIQRVASTTAGSAVRVQLTAAPPEEAAAQRATVVVEPPAPPERPAVRAQPMGAPGLPFPNYTFEAFVPGPSNRFAHAAAMAVAEAPPSKAYNPLFVYGGVGLG
ncbi:MAG TPA: DnaA/Hda family protein, partial [Solirubrobacterales bacterium]|nr:DnaA/Hda family protein [Solirubrobacterales bacterium]